MHFLGNDFIITSLLLLVMIFLFVFYYKEKIFKKYYVNKINDNFKNQVITYLKETYPKFKFNFSIFDKTYEEQDPFTIKYYQVDELINQYINNRPFSNKLLKQIKTNKFWSEYAFYSKPNKNKLPPDWLKRKKVAYDRDNGACVRCSKKIIMKDSILYIVTPIEQNGQYYIENLATLCSDCNKILNSKIKYLQIEENLYNIVKNSI